MFLGKGGVGKTTCAAATALGAADASRDTLCLSTDPTPSLSHIFEVDRGGRERRLRPHLFLTELGRDEVRALWDERFGREVYAVFSAFVDVEYQDFVRFMTSVLPGLNEEFMVDQIRRTALEGRYADLVWDTAPLGQTLALLEMPSMLADHLRMAPRVYSHLRGAGEQRESIMAVLRRWDDLAHTCMAFLRKHVSFSMVTIAEALAVEQLDGVLTELGRYGISIDRLIVNNVVPQTGSEFLEETRTQQQGYLRILRERFRDLPIVEVPLLPHEVRGLARLRDIAAALGAA